MPVAVLTQGMTGATSTASRVRGALARLAGALAASLVLAAPASATTVWAVGDGAVPGREDDELAARVEAAGIDRLLYLGDVYERGSARDFQANYGSSWGRFKSITSPTPGNHEWEHRAVGYDPYWGSRVRTFGGHWYSFDVGDWHFVSLNSENNLGSDSPQLRWLRDDLSRRSGNCTVAFFHRSRYSAGGHPDARATETLWRALAGRSLIALSGHSHNYQRFHPNRGIRQFVVGTGGRRPLDPVDRHDKRLAASDSRSLGALRLVFDGLSVSYAQVALDGRVVDQGSLQCDPHAVPAPPSVAIAHPGGGSAHSTGLRYLRGTSRRADGGVRLTLVRRSPGGCRVHIGRRRLRPAPCGTRRTLAIVSGSRWSSRLPAPRPRGRYVRWARVKSADGRRAGDRAWFRVR